MIYLRDLRLAESGDGYPLNLPSLAGLGARRFSAPVTVFVGENGSGKSTLMEAIARRVGMPALGQYDAETDPTLQAVQPLSDALRLGWSRRPARKFFLRAEDFFGFLKRLAAIRTELMAEQREMEQGLENRSEYAKSLARMPFAASLFEMEHRYGIDPDAQSHGESFLSVFGARMKPGGLYLLDEPESALSPTRQLALVRMIWDLRDSCQFLLATHSPILMAIPGADIWSFDQHPLASALWQDLPQIQILRAFLNAPQRYIEELMREEE